MPKKLALCTTCKGRTQHLERTLPRNLADNVDCQDCVFVILNYNSGDHLLAYLDRHHASDIARGKLVVFSYFDAPTFKMAHAKNMAHRLGILEGAELLVNLDADNFTGPNYAEWVRENLQPGNFLWAGIIKGKGRKYRGSSGRIGVNATDFLKVGGYDEKFETWGHDDADFNARLSMLGLEGIATDLKHLETKWHGDEMRFAEYPEVRERSQSDEMDVPFGAVVNAGKIGLGRIFRNFDFARPMDLLPMPARVFGIGMHKTGTTSLASALNTLGFECAHWPSPRWARDVWEEVSQHGRSPTLERHMAATDLPMPLLYRQLDLNYPGSKFVLTVRSEENWLRSVKNHWETETNRFRASWDEDCFTNKVHSELYGRKKFDAEIFLARYRRHNAEVKEYFRDSPGDLLVMDADHPGWLDLCLFLGRAVPNVAYPQEYVTR